MSLKQIVGLLIILGTVSLSLADDIITVDGTTYSNVKVTDTNGIGIKVMHKAGVAYIPFSDMTDADKLKYGHDPKKEEVALAAKRKQKEERAIQEEVKRQEIANNKKKMSKAYRFNGKVIQVLDDGIIVNGRIRTYDDWQNVVKKMDLADQLMTKAKKIGNIQIKDALQSIELVEQANAILLSISIPEEGDYFIAGITERLADDESWKGYVYYAGFYKYTNTQGAVKTIRAYATSEELANKIFK